MSLYAELRRCLEYITFSLKHLSDVPNKRLKTTLWLEVSLPACANNFRHTAYAKIKASKSINWSSEGRFKSAITFAVNVRFEQAKRLRKAVAIALPAM